jgi:tripartite-type tricarboxylate transporter receptor subunit TctC
MPIHRLLRVASVALGLLLCSIAAAQSYPSKPIRIVVPFAPGVVDITARLLQPKMQEDLGQALIMLRRHSTGCCAPPIFLNLSASQSVRK